MDLVFTVNLTNAEITEKISKIVLSPPDCFEELIAQLRADIPPGQLPIARGLARKYRQQNQLETPRLKMCLQITNDL